MLNITDVRIVPYENGRMLGFASITIGGGLVVNGFKVMSKGDTGEIWVAMPSQKDKNGEYKDTSFCLNKDAREELTGAVIKAYMESQKPQESESSFSSEEVESGFAEVEDDDSIPF